MELEGFKHDENPDMSDIIHMNGLPFAAPSAEVQRGLFFTWFQSVVINGSKRRQYRVPSKIVELPCGCCRDRTNENDPNNTWYIKRKGPLYSHKGCGKEIGDN